jgi:hypothetical protein
MRSSLRSAVIVVLLIVTVLPTPPALASDGWCDTDPLLVIRTPAGLLVPVFVMVSAQSMLFTPDTLLGSLGLKYTVAASNNGTATKVTVVVFVPSSLSSGSSFSTRSIVSTGAYGTGTVYAQQSGVSDEPMTLTFILPVP